MLDFGALHARFDAEPIPYHDDVAERHAGLRHSEVAGVHADDEHLRLACEAPQVFAMRPPRVEEGIVDVTNGLTEAERRESFAQSFGNCDQISAHRDFPPRVLSNPEWKSIRESQARRSIR